ncbi:MAG: hypothetical protein ACW99A_14190 [Candidatus Kariarchaeaceae archaeon]|jgi:Arc/MetJ-type ribon-helix-helix transcriptional regulator
MQDQNNDLIDRDQLIAFEISEDAEEKIKRLIQQGKYSNRASFILVAVDQLLHDELEIERKSDGENN